MTPAAALGLDSRDLSDLLEIIARHAPQAQIWAFGSRVNGRARPFSDLDLALIQDQPLSAPARARLREDLSESRLPFKTDVVEWSRISPSFREVILKSRLVLRGPGRV